MLKRMIMGLVVGLGALSQGGAQPPQSKGPEKAQSAQAPHRGTQEAPLFIDAQVSPKVSEAESKRQAQQDNAKAVFDEEVLQATQATAIFTGVAALIAFVQAWFFRRQLQIMENNLTDTTAAADAARKSAEAASSQAEILMLAQRAWVFQTQISKHPFAHATILGVENLSGMAFELHWTNAGNTPAISTNLYTEWRAVGRNDGVPVFTPPAAAELRAASLAPKAVMNSNTCFMTDQEVQQLRRGEISFFLFARADYRDIFKVNVPRSTEFCTEVRINGDEIAQDGTRLPRFTFSRVGPQNTAT